MYNFNTKKPSCEAHGSSEVHMKTRGGMAFCYCCSTQGLKATEFQLGQSYWCSGRGQSNAAGLSSRDPLLLLGCPEGCRELTRCACAFESNGNGVPMAGSAWKGQLRLSSAVVGNICLVSVGLYREHDPFG